MYVDADAVEARDGGFFYNGEPVTREFGKMGKSLKNSVTPDDICRDYGADTFRLYEMFMGPLDKERPWNTGDIAGVHRFLQRLWRNLIDEHTGELRVSDAPPDDETRRVLNRTIAAVRSDMAALGFNTAIARLFELNNHLTASEGGVSREVAEPLVLMVAPLAPHIAEELWARLGHDDTLAYEAFPVADEAWLVQDTVEVPVQVNGKVRARISVPAGADEAAHEAAARADAHIAELLAGAAVRKVVVVPGRTVNFVLLSRWRWRAGAAIGCRRFPLRFPALFVARPEVARWGSRIHCSNVCTTFAPIGASALRCSHVSRSRPGSRGYERARTTAGSPGAAPTTESTVVHRASSSTTQPEVIVDVVGAVRAAGVVRMPAGARVYDAIAAAGGATADADVEQLNLAARLADGARIAVPHKGETLPPATGDRHRQPRRAGAGRPQHRHTRTARRAARRRPGHSRGDRARPRRARAVSQRRRSRPRTRHRTREVGAAARSRVGLTWSPGRSSRWPRSWPESLPASASGPRPRPRCSSSGCWVSAPRS